MSDKIPHQKLENYAAEFADFNVLSAEIGIIRPCDTNARGGAQTEIVIRDLSCTAISIEPLKDSMSGDDNGVKIVLRGDAELRTIIRALEWISERLREVGRIQPMEHRGRAFKAIPDLAVNDLIRSENYGREGCLTIVCPLCLCNNFHLGSTWQEHSQDLGQTVEQLAIEGECGHRYILQFFDEKGTTYIRPVVVPGAEWDRIVQKRFPFDTSK